MTLENCQRLLKHYKDLADGTVKQPFGHKDWPDVVANAKVRAKAMEERIAHKLEGKSKLTNAVYFNHPVNVAKREKEEKKRKTLEEEMRKEEEKKRKENKPKEKKDGKRPA